MKVPSCGCCGIVAILIHRATVEWVLLGRVVWIVVVTLVIGVVVQFIKEVIVEAVGTR